MGKALRGESLREWLKEYDQATFRVVLRIVLGANEFSAGHSPCAIGELWTTMDRLMVSSGCSRRELRRALATLEARSLISRTRFLGQTLITVAGYETYMV